MKWEVRVNPATIDGTRLRVRTGPSTSYRIVGYKYANDGGNVVDTKTTNGQTWYKWEGTEYWSCATDSNGSQYLLMMRDLEEKPPQPEEKPVETPVEDTITIESIKPNLNGYRSDEESTKNGNWDSPWYQPMTFGNTQYDVVDDTTIAKNIAALKHNMDISYTTIDDVYDGYQVNGNTGYVSTLQKKLYNSFNRNKTTFPDQALPKTFAYVFFTRPDLNILERASNSTAFKLVKEQTDGDSKFTYLWKNNPWCLKSLIDAGNPYHKFMVLLSNEAKSFEVGDIALKTVEHGETYNGNKIIYGFSDQEANAAGEMSIRYEDTVNLDIFKLHLAWTDYINKVSRGIFNPKREYMMGKIIDYAASCYYFLCGPDGNTILYWQKLTGVFPVNTGENAFSWDSGTLLAKPEINIKYMYSFKTPMDVYSIHEFNTLSSKSISAKQILDTKEGERYGVQTGSTLTHAPHVFRTVDTEGNLIYRLMWVENK